MQPSFYEPSGPRTTLGPGGAIYSSHYTTVLKHVLDQARTGSLSPDWRAHIPRPAVIFNGSTRFREAGAVANQRLGDMEPQPWEPGQAADWRQALDAWFAGSRGLLAVEHTGFIELQLHTLMTSERTLGHQVSRVDATAGEPDATTSPWSVVGGEFLNSVDRTLRGSVDNYIVQRDWLTASYLGGLAAGGSAILDWRRWLTGRADEWIDANGTYRNRVQHEARSPVGSHPIDKLPTYWLDRLPDLDTETNRDHSDE